jgi:glycosyltransferase involved in cell wall biosynthesis
MRVALVHDWLNGMRGGEKVFEVLCELFPHADVYTLFYESNKVSPTIRAMNISEWWVPRHFPFLRRYYRYLLPAFPWAIESLPIENYELVISTSHCVAKGIRPKGGRQPFHICYCFTPMRYLWDKYDDYFGDWKKPSSMVMRLLRRPLQSWDVKSNANVSQFIAPSEYVRQRIQRIYSRDAIVIPSPVDYTRFASIERHPQDYFLVVSALEPYKRIDVAIAAFNRLGYPLIIAGTGSEKHRLSQIAGSNIHFTGWVSDEELCALYAGARALIFPADEDFGIVPLEAMAAGCPVIAFRKGGALETVSENVSGIFFDAQHPEVLIEAVKRFQSMTFDESVIRKQAQPFARETFKRRLAETISKLASIPLPHPS